MITVRVESIYGVALSKILLDSKEDIVLSSPNEEIQSSLNIENKVGILDVHINDTEDRRGINLKGNSESVDLVSSIIRDELYDTIKFSHEEQQDAIYISRVKNVLKRKNTGFLDLGEGKTGIIFESNLMDGEDLIVQIKELPIEEGRYPVCSQNINLTGKFVILEKSEEAPFVRVSKKIQGELRDRIHSLGKELVPDGFGIIMRTSAVDVSKEKIEEEIMDLKKLWQRVEKAKEKDRLGKVHTGEKLVTFHFNYNTKVKLDKIRKVIEPIIDNYHVYRSYSYATGFSANLANKFLDKVSASNFSDVMKKMILQSDYRENHVIKLNVLGLDGTNNEVYLGNLKDVSDHFMIQKSLDQKSAESTETNFILYPGDYIETHLDEGSWTIHYRYFSGEDKSLIGERIQLVTPIELSFRGKFSTVSLGINIYKDAKTKEIDLLTDDDAGEDLLEKEIISSNLDMKLGETIEDIIKTFQSSEDLIIRK